jgi:hypothetical protein
VECSSCGDLNVTPVLSVCACTGRDALVHPMLKCCLNHQLLNRKILPEDCQPVGNSLIDTVQIYL